MEHDGCNEPEKSIDSQLMLVEAFHIPQLDNSIRLSDLSFTYFRSLKSRKAVKKAIKSGCVFVNNSLGYTGDYIKGGELIEVYQGAQNKTGKSIKFKLDVIYEDDYIAVVRKPAGIVVSGNKKWTLENALSFNLKKSGQNDALANPEPIHRLDYPTSGVLLIGKTNALVIQLNKMFEDRRVKKMYYAVTIGTQSSQGFIDSKIDGKESRSHYRVIKSIPSPKYGFLNLVELEPHTGRRHQLRKHLAGIGNPILGDLLYGEEGLLLKGKGLYLHANSLIFTHPISNQEIRAFDRLPKKFLKLFPEVSDLEQP